MPWIRFSARMYNATDNVYIDAAFQLYSIAYCPADNFSMFYDGTTRTDIPLGQFDGLNNDNIGIVFERTAKEYYRENGHFPTLRLCTTNSVDDYFLEWSPSYKNGFTIKAGNSSRWESCYQWSDSIGARDAATVYAYVFVTVWDKNQLNTESIVWNGSCYGSGSTWNTRIGYATLTVSIHNGAYLKQANDQLAAINLLATATSPDNYRYYTAKNNPQDPSAGVIICALLVWNNEWVGPLMVAPLNSGNFIRPYICGCATSGDYVSEYVGYQDTVVLYGITWGVLLLNPINLTTFPFASWQASVPVVNIDDEPDGAAAVIKTIQTINPTITTIRDELYTYLTGQPSVEPGSDVDPDNPPDPETPPQPITPDNPDPYYSPSSDPQSPDYDPTKDPTSPSYDPSTPHTPYNPPSTEGGGGTPDLQPAEDTIPAPQTPSSYVTTNALFTLYNPTAADLTNLANFLWSPAWSIDTFKKIFANPLDCILGLMVMPYLTVDVGTKNMSVGNIDSGVAMRYFTKQFCDFDCGNFTIEEFYKSYLDYAPYTKVNIFLPYIGDQQLNTDEVMGKSINVKYRFDLASGDCVAFVSVDSSVLYSFSGNCAARLPLSGNNYGGLLPSITGAVVASGSMAAGVPALGAASALAVSSMKQDIRHTGSISGSAGLMGVQTPYLIITRPRQAIPIGQNSFTGYPSFITESLGGLNGYTEVESCHLEHIPCTDEELKEIENLLKGGVLF